MDIWCLDSRGERGWMCAWGIMVDVGEVDWK
jgi:hypothetical protein